MFCNWKKWKNCEYHPRPALKRLQIILLALIVVGLALLATQRLWVPRLVDHILKNENERAALETAASVEFPVPIPTHSPLTPKSVLIPPPKPGSFESGFEGVVTVGPTCPEVSNNPHDMDCEDKPLQTTLAITAPVSNGRGIRVESDAAGHFSQDLPPGAYTVSSYDQSFFPRLEPVDFVVKARERLVMNLKFDSGIR